MDDRNRKESRRQGLIGTGTRADAKKYPLLKEAHKTLDEISQDSEARLEYDKRQAAIYFHEMALEKRYSEGKLEGKQEGLLEGKLEIAQKMLEKGIDSRDVLEITGLTLEQLKEAKIV